MRELSERGDLEGRAAAHAARLYAELGDPASARWVLERALRTAPGDAPPWLAAAELARRGVDPAAEMKLTRVAAARASDRLQAAAIRRRCVRIAETLGAEEAARLARQRLQALRPASAMGHLPEVAAGHTQRSLDWRASQD